MIVKICGIRRPEDVEMLNATPPDFAGFILSKPYRRFVPLELFRKLVLELDGKIGRVGVFVNPEIEEIAGYAPYLDVIQLHGEEDADLIHRVRECFPDVQIWKAVRVRTAADAEAAQELPVDKLLLDSFTEGVHGGTGTVAPWEEIKKAAVTMPFLLAGGLSAENLAKAAAFVEPWGVDVSSALETDGCKDAEKIRHFMEAAKPFRI